MTHKQDSTTFVGAFVKYLKSRTDCPPEFHPHAALVSLAVALGNNVWIDDRSDPVYTNLWIVVLAPSGYGKSVPLNFSRSFVERAGLGESVLPASFSQEALLDALKTNPVGVFYPQEFAAFIATLGREYNTGAMELLTELYDAPPTFRRRLRSGTFEIRNPALSILGASSPDWFAQSFKASMLRGGFLARFLFCPSSTPGKYVPDPGPRSERVEGPLAKHLAQVHQLRGCADLSGVMKRFNEWERETRESSRRDCPPEFSGMRSRASVLVKKAAVLFHVSEDPTSLVVEDEDLELAIAYVEHSQRLAEDYLTNEVAHNAEDADRLRLLELVRAGGGCVQWSKGLKDSHLSAFKFRNAVETLAESDRLRVEKRDSSRYLVLNDGRALRVVAGNSPEIRGEFAEFAIPANSLNGAL